MILRTIFVITILAGFSMICQTGQAMDNVTIRGKITNPRHQDLPIQLNQLNIKLEEQVQFDPLPTPANWEKMEVADRQKWFKEFRESEKGKAFFDKRQKLYDNRKQFDIEIEEDGKFVVFDVPPGSYGIGGRLNQSFKNKQFAFEVFGQVDVGKVDELQLGEMQVLVTRLLSVKETVPGFEIQSLNGEKQYRQDSFKNKFLLINFWSAQSPPCVNDLKTLAKMHKGLKTISADIEFLSVCMDPDPANAGKLVKEDGIIWPQAKVDGWQAKMVEDFGVRSIPFYCLVDQKGKVVINNALFYQLFQTGEINFDQILRDALAGKDMQKRLEELQKQAEKQEGDTIK